MSEYNILKAEGKPADQDPILELESSGGVGYKVKFTDSGIKFFVNGTLRFTIDEDGEVLFSGATVPEITGDTSAYVEGTITGIIDALVAVGLVTDGTTT